MDSRGPTTGNIFGVDGYTRNVGDGVSLRRSDKGHWESSGLYGFGVDPYCRTDTRFYTSRMGKHGPNEVVVYNGMRYRRYPESKNRSMRVYYSDSKYNVLHHAVWADAHGPVPAGHCIHHKDGNPLNNSIENLEAMSRSDHTRMHASEPGRVARSREIIDSIRHLAAPWHSSAAGRAWHSENGKKCAAARAKKECTCVVCGRAFMSVRESAKVCGGYCYHKQRLASGLDDIDVTCPECLRVFRSNKYKPSVCCTVSCATRVKNRKRRERLQSER